MSRDTDRAPYTGVAMVMIATLALAAVACTPGVASPGQPDRAVVFGYGFALANVHTLHSRDLRTVQHPALDVALEAFVHADTARQVWRAERKPIRARRPALTRIASPRAPPPESAASSVGVFTRIFPTLMRLKGSLWTQAK